MINAHAAMFVRAGAPLFLHGPERPVACGGAEPAP
jgi:hypothetical protein